MFAGQETTASTTSWVLYELSKHPIIQTRIREEIKATRVRASNRGINQELTVNDLESMKWLLAVMKVGHHCSMYALSRTAS